MKNRNNSQNPEFLNDYLVHIKVVMMLSERTIDEYYLDIRLFLKYIYGNMYEIDEDINDIDISGMTAGDLQKITTSDIYQFIFYAADQRKNSPKARYRKVSSLRSFFKYTTKVAHITEKDPTRDIEMPSPKNALPRYLSLNESVRLLESSGNGESVRNFCILTLFLNCGMRLSELVSINISDVDFIERKIRIMGKGQKERMVYLNDACVSALENYLAVREENKKARHEPALFISNQNRRISNRRVQQIVDESLKAAGLGGKGLTTHKLRHTAATLMYQYGDADLLTLKELLGHSNTATTEIYTHLDTESVRHAVEENPLAGIKMKKY